MIVIHPAAQQELIEAAAYYEEHLTGLGSEYSRDSLISCITGRRMSG